MTNAFSLNVIRPTARKKGALAGNLYGVKRNTLEVQINPLSTETFGFGTPVKIIGNVKGITVVDKIASTDPTTDKIFGIILETNKRETFSAGEIVVISLGFETLYLEASEPLAVGTKVAPVLVGDKIATWSTGLSEIGTVEEVALADGNLVAVRLVVFNDK